MEKPGLMKEELATGEGKSIPGQGRLRSRMKPGTLNWEQEARVARPAIRKSSLHLTQKTKGRSGQRVASLPFLKITLKTRWITI